MKSYAIPRAICFFMVVAIFLFPEFVSAEDPRTDSQQELAIRMIQRDIQLMSRKLDQIYTCIKGNGKPGIETRVALVESKGGLHLWWMAGLSMTILGMCFIVIRQKISGGIGDG